MIYISASSIKDFLKCQKRLYYRFNHPDQQSQTAEMLVGTIVHKVLEDMWDEPQDIAVRYADSLAEPYGFDDDSTGKIKDSLNSYYRNYKYLVGSGDLIEHRFDIKLEKDVSLVGRVDRITTSGLVLDWKTGQSIPKSIETDVQFLIYYLAYVRMYSKPPEGVYYVPLITRSKGMIKLNIDSSLLDILVLDIIPNMVYNIRRNTYVRDGIFNNECKHCQFITKCYQDLRGTE